VPVLREQGSGHIFQVSSLSVRWSAPGLTAYQAAKWAVAGFSIGLAQGSLRLACRSPCLSRAACAPTGPARR
jgi:NADP-dependent 3-hydroxy acid dehydrogenase YdfG